jgi:hypothetical protein
MTDLDWLINWLFTGALLTLATLCGATANLLWRDPSMRYFAAPFAVLGVMCVGVMVNIACWVAAQIKRPPEKP